MEEYVPLADTFTGPARRVFALAREEADRLGVATVDSSLVLLGMLGEEEGGAGRMLERAGMRVRPLRKKIRGLSEPGSGGEEAGFSPMLEQAITISYGLAAQMGHELVGTEHLLLGLLAVEDPLSARLLADENIAFDDLSRSVLMTLNAL